MADLISLALARGLSKVPAYTPPIVPRVADAPWPVPSNEHPAAIAKWGANTRAAKRELFRMAVPIQSWILYQLRFLITAELMGALSTFGGLADCPNHLSIVLNIATMETVAAALSYGRLVMHHLEEKARSRADDTLGVGTSRAFCPPGILLSGCMPSRNALCAPRRRGRRRLRPRSRPRTPLLLALGITPAVFAETNLPRLFPLNVAVRRLRAQARRDARGPHVRPPRARKIRL